MVFEKVEQPSLSGVLASWIDSFGISTVALDGVVCTRSDQKDKMKGTLWDLRNHRHVSAKLDLPLPWKDGLHDVSGVRSYWPRCASRELLLELPDLVAE